MMGIVEPLWGSELKQLSYPNIRSPNYEIPIKMDVMSITSGQLHSQFSNQMLQLVGMLK